MQEPDFSIFESKININFNDKKLLKQVFVHRSYLNENPGLGLEHNERLEYLGDAVLELVVTEFLYHKFRDMAEGELTNIRAAMVNTNMLSVCARELAMNDYLLLSRGEAKDLGRARHYILANVFEALVGAIYLDGGYESTKDFISKNLFPKLDGIMKLRLFQDPKSLFQERAQESENITPTYKVLSDTGPDHNKTFTVGLFLEEKLISKGIGHSKQEAEQNAARGGLKDMGWADK